MAVRRGQVDGESVLRLLASLPESLEGVAENLAAGAACWSVRRGVEEEVLARSSLGVARTTFLSTAIGDELSDTWSPADLRSRPSATGAMRLSLEHLCLPVSCATARCVSSWATCGATLHSCPSAVVAALVGTSGPGPENALGADRSTTVNVASQRCQRMNLGG